MNVFTIPFEQFNVSLLNKMCYFFKNKTFTLYCIRNIAKLYSRKLLKVFVLMFMRVMDKD